MASTPRCGREPCAARPVTSTSLHTNPLCATATSELGGLGDDRRIGGRRAQRLLHPEAGVLLVGHRGHDDVPAQARARRLARGDQRSGHAGLHVVGAAPVEPIALDPRCVRRLIPSTPTVSRWRAEQQRPPATTPLRAEQHARPARRGLEHLGLEPGLARPASHEAPRSPPHRRRPRRAPGSRSRSPRSSSASTSVTSFIELTPRARAASPPACPRARAARCRRARTEAGSCRSAAPGDRSAPA